MAKKRSPESIQALKDFKEHFQRSAEEVRRLFDDFYELAYYNPLTGRVDDISEALDKDKAELCAAAYARISNELDKQLNKYIKGSDLFYNKARRELSNIGSRALLFKLRRDVFEQIRRNPSGQASHTANPYDKAFIALITAALEVFIMNPTQSPTELMVESNTAAHIAYRDALQPVPEHNLEEMYVFTEAFRKAGRELTARLYDTLVNMKFDMETRNSPDQNKIILFSNIARDRLCAIFGLQIQHYETIPHNELYKDYGPDGREAMRTLLREDHIIDHIAKAVEQEKSAEQKQLRNELLRRELHEAGWTRRVTKNEIELYDQCRQNVISWVNGFIDSIIL